MPSFVFADCSNNGYTVVYVNGIFTTEASARADEQLLKDIFYIKTKRSDVDFVLGYNPSHLDGLGDVAKAVLQAYGVAGLDTDLISILQQVHSELSTRKVLLVGHSQGTFYTNAAYDYLVNNGVPRESIGIYNIATPADYVAGSGNYVTSSTDKVINAVVRDWATNANAKKPLPANITISLSAEEQADKNGGHSLSGVYLANEAERIVGDMNLALSNLSGASADADECFTKPKEDIAQKMRAVGIAGLDGATKVVAITYRGAKNTVKLAINYINEFIDFVSKNRNLLVAGLNAPQISGNNSPSQTPSDIIDVQRL